MGKQRIAFDIGESSVKMIHVSGKEIRNAAVAELPDNMVENGRILSPDAMADFIREHMKAGHLPKAEAAVILPASLMFVRSVTVPLMTAQQLEFNLPYEFKDYLREEKSKYLFDYAVSEIIRDEESGDGSMRIFACATLKETVEEYRMMFKRAGLKLKLAIPEECAYMNLVRSAAQLAGGDCCFADIGQHATGLHLFHAGEYSTKRSIEIGLRQLDAIIADRHQVDIHMAHTYKENNYNHVLTEGDALAFYNNLAVEMTKALNFFNYNNRDAELKDIYLCGGGAEIEPLVNIIRDTTHMEVHPAQELMPKKNDMRANLFLQGYGLAIGE